MIKQYYHHIITLLNDIKWQEINIENHPMVIMMKMNLINLINNYLPIFINILSKNENETNETKYEWALITLSPMCGVCWLCWMLFLYMLNVQQIIKINYNFKVYNYFPWLSFPPSLSLSLSLSLSVFLSIVSFYFYLFRSPTYLIPYIIICSIIIIIMIALMCLW